MTVWVLADSDAMAPLVAWPSGLRTLRLPKSTPSRMNWTLPAGVAVPDAALTVAAVAWTEPELRDLKAIEQATRAGALLAGRAKEAGIQTSIHYRPVDTFTAYVDAGLGPSPHVPLSHAVGDRVVTLPLFPNMTEAQVGYVCEALGAALNRVTRVA